MLQRWMMYALVIVGVVAVYSAYAMWSYKSRREKFEAAVPVGADDPAAQSGAPLTNKLSPYDARMYTIRTFETVLHRKPTDAELKKYAALATEDAIMKAIVNDLGDVGQAAKAAREGSCTDAENSDESDESDESDSDDEDDAPPPPKPKKAPKPIPSSAKDYRSCEYDDEPPEPVDDCSSGRVCMDKKDVIARLNAIDREIRLFRKLVLMM